MSKQTTKALARIIDEIEYPEMFFEGFQFYVTYSLNGKKFGRTLSVIPEATDEMLRYACKRFIDEVIRTRNNQE